MPERARLRFATTGTEEWKIYWFWLNIPLAAAFFGAMVGIPMWLILKRPGWGSARPPAAQASNYAQQAQLAEPHTASAERRSDDLVGVA